MTNRMPRMRSTLRLLRRPAFTMAPWRKPLRLEPPRPRSLVPGVQPTPDQRSGEVMRSEPAGEARQKSSNDASRACTTAMLEPGRSCWRLAHARRFGLVVDDRFLKIGSSELNNRSMGLDTECDLAIEVEEGSGDEDRIRAAIRLIRDDLIAEHLGTMRAAVKQARAPEGALVGARPPAPPGRPHAAGPQPQAAQRDRGPVGRAVHSRSRPASAAGTEARPFPVPLKARARPVCREARPTGATEADGRRARVRIRCAEGKPGPG